MPGCARWSDHTLIAPEFSESESKRETIDPKDFSSGNYIAIRSSEGGNTSGDGRYVFGRSPHFGLLVAGLSKLGFPKTNLLRVGKYKACRLRDQDGEECTYINKDSHLVRHIYTHLPDNLGFFVACPACGYAARRGDMFDRHAGRCARKHGIPQAELKDWTLDCVGHLGLQR